jgi:hypothetical protein
MYKIYPFFFRFGVSFSYTIAEEIIQRIADYLIKKFNVELQYFDDKQICETIEITDEEAANNSSIIASKFLIKCNQYEIDMIEKKVFFIDIKQAYSDKFYPYLFNELSKLHGQYKMENREIPTFIVLVNSIDEFNNVYNSLYTLNRKNQFLTNAFIIDIKGNYLNSNDLKVYNDSTLYEFTQEISTSFVDIFISRLIRKINHFKILRDERHSSCQLYFYETSNNDNVILFNLLMNKVLEARQEIGEINYIVYDSADSPWLRESIISLTDTLLSETMKSRFGNYLGSFDLRNKTEFEEFETELKNNGKQNYNVVFITDLIHTGKTIKGFILKLQSITNINFKCHSLLVTEHAFEKYGNDDILEIEGKAITYYQNVKQKFFKNLQKKECEFCKYDILPLVNVTCGIEPKITAFEMWQMCFEAGYKHEDYIPEWRENTPILQHSLKLFKANSPLLATKFEMCLKNTGIYDKEVVIVFPDERIDKDIKLEDTPSGFFVRCLSLFNNNYNYLGIPRTLINQLKKNEIEYDDIDKDITDKLIKINAPIVVVDEVNISADTFKIIYNILKSVDKYPTCFFPIFNYNMTDTQKLNEELEDNKLQFLSLYEYDLIQA